MYEIINFQLKLVPWQLFLIQLVPMQLFSHATRPNALGELEKNPNFTQICNTKNE